MLPPVEEWPDHPVRARVDVAQPQSLIVIVEDDEGMRNAIARLLRAAGYTTAAFESAEALLQARVVERAICFVLDVRLPGMSGFELRGHLVEAGPNIAVIFVTAHDEPSIREVAARIGADAYLPKPFSRMALLDAISHIVHRASKEEC
jgi:FixJ family two-component response regulator